MTIQQMAAIASVISSASQTLMPIIGGVKAVAALFGMKEPTPEQQAAITALVVADATRRRDESLLMLGPEI